MLYNRLISILIILTLLSCFLGFEFYRKSDKYVLDIIRPDVIKVDLNGNKVFDAGETICIPEINTFSANLSENQPELSKILNLTDSDAIKLGYITDNFAENILANKRVKLKYSGEKNQNCIFADITINNQSYRNKLLDSGLGFYKGKPAKKSEFEKQLAKAKKLNLVILNHRSSKYHKLNCKYGLVARDSVIIPAAQLPQDVKPCKFCHLNNNKKIMKKNLPQKYSLIAYPLAISNGSIKMYLTDLTTKLKPDGKCSSLACKEILNGINNTQETLDIALYGWDKVEEIQNAIINAKSRGVKIRIVYDTSKNNYYPETKELIKLADESATETNQILMHNKFMIFDNQKLVTGSMNFSDTDFSGFNSNCLFFINSSEIAQIYLEEFNQMLSGRFHNDKKPVKHKTVLLGNTKVTPYFSPTDKIITKNVIPLVNSAKKYIYIPAFILTHDELATALIQAKKRGVDVKIIIDATNTFASRSKVKILRNATVPVKVENYAGKVHSKTIIIDDKYIIAGSMNFTKSGESKNDENALIIEDARLARYYRGFFEYLWKKIPDKYLKQGVRAEGKYSIGSCADSVDNNFDGKIDMEDAGCKN